LGTKRHEEDAMKTTGSIGSLEFRAVEALRALLGQVSVIKLKDIQRIPAGPMLARLDVLGHSHTLACEIEPNTRPESLRNALDELSHDAAHYHGAATPVLIAPYLSPEAQAVCKERSACYLDLEGNARLALGEVFIGKRSMPPRAAIRAVEATVPPQVLQSFPARAAAPAHPRRATA
jgi:hypothetical protein